MTNHIFWNCRDANNKIFPNVVKTLGEIHNLGILFIFEPRIGGTGAKRVTKKLGFSNFFVEDTRGYARGIWIFWSDPTIKIQIAYNNSQVVTCVVGTMKEIWCLTAIYTIFIRIIENFFRSI